MADLSVAGSQRSALEHGVPLRQAFHTWLRVASLSFGGPVGQIAVMHRILVEEKRWVSEERFLHALNYCMLLPGHRPCRHHARQPCRQGDGDQHLGRVRRERRCGLRRRRLRYAGERAPAVLRAMRKEGTNIVAIHQHMSHEQPRYLFLHYWGKGKAVDLAQSLKRVLDAPAAVKS